MPLRIHRLLGPVALMLLAVLVGACGVIGASEITLNARNETDEPMVVRVIDGVDGASAPYGPPHSVPPGGEQSLTLAVPGGQWTVTVNGARLVESSDVGSRRGPIPMTLVLPSGDHFAGGPYWEAPLDWAETGR